MRPEPLQHCTGLGCSDFHLRATPVFQVRSRFVARASVQTYEKRLIKLQ
jgi:hypothetical protein